MQVVRVNELYWSLLILVFGSRLFDALVLVSCFSLQGRRLVDKIEASKYTMPSVSAEVLERA